MSIKGPKTQAKPQLSIRVQTDLVLSYLADFSVESKFPGQVISDHSFLPEGAFGSWEHCVQQLLPWQHKPDRGS